MRRKIFLFAALLSGFAVIATSVLIIIAAHNDIFEAVKQEVKAQVFYIRSGIELSGDDYLRNIEPITNHRITLIASDGKVLFDSFSNPDKMDNHSDRPEVSAALERGTGEATRFSETIREQTYYFAVLLDNGSVLRISSTTASIFAYYDHLFWIVILIVCAVLLISGLTASLLTRRIVRPINEIDLNYPESGSVYEELIPLLTRVREQREQLRVRLLELDRGRSEFAAITENMSEGFLVLDHDGRVLSHNKSAVKLLNLQTDIQSGISILSLNRSAQFRDAVHFALEGTAKEVIVDLGGRTCQLYTNPVLIDGIVHGVVLLIMDITEKQEREKLRREFTANVSHELKTPLTAISGYAEIIANGVVKSEDVPEFSGYIYQEAQRMIALVKDLMFLSKLDESMVPAKEPVNLFTLSKSVSERLKTKADANGVAIEVTGDDVTVSGIPSVLEEVIYNLADNAVKYNSRGGMVKIVVRMDSSCPVLTVSDTGIGISKADQERIFERFYRVDKSHNEAVDGTGLGLAIVKHGAALHDAKIEVESNKDGSKFKLVFPIQP